MRKSCNQDNSNSAKLKWLDAYLPLIGEFVWHSLTSDSTIEAVSKQHFEFVSETIDRWTTKKPSTILEVGAYAHATGYALQKKYDAEVTLFDLSAATLRLGNKMVGGKGVKVDLVSGDFHTLPFVDGYFDVVYLFAALHHAANYQQVVKELQRVLAPNGLLCLFQEPIKREACFYKFRTNRVHNFTNFEKSLAAEGLLTTVAEPSPGSRDEILFGMIENQEIPLQQLVDSFTSDCVPLEIQTYYKKQMGELGNLWLTWGKAPLSSSGLSHKIAGYLRRLLKGKIGEPGSLCFKKGASPTSSSGLSHKIADDLRARLNKIRPALDMTALGLGFRLPDDKEIKALSNRIAEKIQALPNDSESKEYSCQVASLFGGVLKFIGQKQLCPTTPHKDQKIVRNKYLAEYPVEAGVRMALPDTVRSVLNQSISCIPKLEGSNKTELRRIFPETDWSLELQDNGFFALSLINTIGEIILPIAEEILFVLRINFMLPKENKAPYCFRLSNSSKEFTWQVFQEEAILYREILEGSIKQNNVVQAKVEVLGDLPEPNGVGLVKIYYAGAFPLKVHV